jgi:hypothetical protein
MRHFSRHDPSQRMITQPERSARGASILKPILTREDVTNSIGQIMHHTRPNNTALMMINGHQYDQTIRFARLVFLRTFANSVSSVLAASPPQASPHPLSFLRHLAPELGWCAGFASAKVPCRPIHIGLAIHRIVYR